MYFSSVLISERHNLKLVTEAELPDSGRVKIGLDALDSGRPAGGVRLFLRIPDWVKEPEKIACTINGAPAQITCADKNRICIAGLDMNKDVIELDFPMHLEAVGLADDDKVFGIKYGPVVLSADLGRENMSTTITGVDVTVPARRIAETEIIVLPDGVSREQFVEDPGRLFKTAGSIPEFSPEGSKLVFSPHFLRYRDRYGIYFYYLTGSEAREAADEGRFGSGDTVDTVMPGYGQYENDELHAMKESDTESVTSGATYRIAKAGGAFSYRMAVEKGKKNRISMMLRLCDNRKPLKITADGVSLYDGVLAYRGTDQYYKLELELPAEVVEGAEHITANGSEYDVIRVAFSGTAEEASAAVCDHIRTEAFGEV